MIPYIRNQTVPIASDLFESLLAMPSTIPLASATKLNWCRTVQQPDNNVWYKPANEVSAHLGWLDWSRVADGLVKPYRCTLHSEAEIDKSQGFAVGASHLPSINQFANVSLLRFKRNLTRPLHYLFLFLTWLSKRKCSNLHEPLT